MEDIPDINRRNRNEELRVKKKTGENKTTVNDEKIKILGTQLREIGDRLNRQHLNEN